MEKEQRNRLQKATQDARRLLEAEFSSQLLQTYDIDVEKVRWAEEPGVHLQAEQRLIRDKLVAWIEHKEAQIHDRKEALLLALREMAFTALNRFVALKLMEARELVRPCVSGGLESAGFLEFTAVAQGLLADQESSYRLYLETIFEDVSRELRALFDPRDPASLLWPKRAALLELLDILNRPELTELWNEDETLGWVYQYFNGDAERRKMREESAAPRNSRELAVRNQFFTPRYVVEFLTDNTLGRIWYEMRQGNTGLKDRCHYLVRRPNEIWLQRGEEPPAQPETDEPLSQEELLRQPVHIPHRPLKDPREIRMLDPACGSMHFGLYSFDLYLEIYQEAWEIAKSSDDQVKQADAFAPFVAYAADFASKEVFLREVPRLILLYNIHGVDIDPRATQIARLTLWLRAQRAWQEQRVQVADSPPITRSNVVCAEPMPGERELLADFVDQQFPKAEQGLVERLLEAIFDKMLLSGEAGSLLKIENEIREAIDQARKEWQRLAIQQRDLFDSSELAAMGEMGSSISDDLNHLANGFWVDIEERIYKALSLFSQKADDELAFQCRLFAEDAASGFAFIETCRKKYDVVLMNPPFGQLSKPWILQAKQLYPASYNDILGAFVERGLELLTPSGVLGAITARTCFFLSSFSEWRESVIGRKGSLSVVADLGQGVMDDAMVEAASYIVSKMNNHGKIPFFRCIAEADRRLSLHKAIEKYREGKNSSLICLANPGSFSLLPNSQFAYWMSRKTLLKLAGLPLFKDRVGEVRQGLATADNPRFVRALWEIPPSDRLSQHGGKWAPYIMAGASQPWFSPITLAVNWAKGAAELWSNLAPNGKVRSNIWMLKDSIRLHFFKPGFSWTLRAPRFIPYVVPSGCIPSASRYVAIPATGMLVKAMGVCSSRIASGYLRLYAEVFERPKFLVGDLKSMPWPSISQEAEDHFSGLIATEVRKRRLCYRTQEPYIEFLAPAAVLCRSGQSDGLEYNMERLLDAPGEQYVADAYNLDKYEVAEIERDLQEALQFIGRGSSLNSDLEDGEEESSNEDVLDLSEASRQESLLSYLVGVSFGRWDVRYASGSLAAPELSDPFDPIPICPPGLLQDSLGLPLEQSNISGSYPVVVSWSGILVVDPAHSLDITNQARTVIDSIWSGDGTASRESVETTACKVLNTSSLREYFSRPGSFFAHHLKRYSKSRRQAPIYWQLSCGSGSYSVWLYYHRFTQDTLYRVLRDFVEPRIQQAERDQFELESQGALSGDAATRLQEAQTLLQDLRIFKSELDLVAPLWHPNLNDGVIINHAILWRITPYTPWQKKCKECWDKLVKGDYDWAHLAFHLWPERVIPKCTTDRSLAIAHGLEERLWQETNNGNWLPRQLSEADLQALIAEHSNPAVKSALERFLAAPPPVAPARTRAPRATRSTASGTTRTPRGSTAVVDAEATRQTLLVLTAAPAEGLSRNAIAELLSVEAASLTAVIKQLKASDQIEQLGAARGARYRLTEQTRARLAQEEVEP